MNGLRSCPTASEYIMIKNNPARCNENQFTDGVLKLHDHAISWAQCCDPPILGLGGEIEDSFIHYNRISCPEMFWLNVVFLNVTWRRVFWL